MSADSNRHCEPGLVPGEAIHLPRVEPVGKAGDGLPRRPGTSPGLLAMTIVGLVGFLATPAHAQTTAQTRATVDASAPSARAVTIYRDPDRGEGEVMARDDPRGFAMISETRAVTLPPGESTIRFTGVAEGMVAVSVIVTGLPGGTIEKNRNADLLSPAALVDGTLGNRVRITRSNPATGAQQSESAIIRTRADGGLVLQTDAGFEAVRCAGIPERLEFPAVPAGLAADPVFSIDTQDASGGTYTVTLTYLAWGFDWDATYIATLHPGRRADDVRFDLTSWLTVLNDNAQSFADAQLLVVAGRLNVESDYQALADAPEGRPLQLTCYPLGSTAAGSPVPDYRHGPYPPAPMMMEADGAIVVTAMRREAAYMDSPMAVGAISEEALASEEDLGDLKLYRVPMPVTVAAQGLKQVAFLDRRGVEGRLLYTAGCWAYPWQSADQSAPAQMLLETVNDRAHGLGVALPTGAVAVYERGERGELLVGEQRLRDYASGQDVELHLGPSAQVSTRCERVRAFDEKSGRWGAMRATFTNANPRPVTLRLYLGATGDFQLRGIRTRLKDGGQVAEITVPANGERVVEWEARPAAQ